MTLCPDCGEYLERIDDRVFKCSISGFYYISSYGELGPPLSEAPTRLILSQRPPEPKETIKAKGKRKMSHASAEKQPTPKKYVELTEEQNTWIRRVAERLVKSEWVREKIRKGLAKCLKGEKEFGEWFDEQKVARGLQSYELVKVLYDSLEGLSGREISGLRKQYEELLQRLGAMYAV